MDFQKELRARYGKPRGRRYKLIWQIKLAKDMSVRNVMQSILLPVVVRGRFIAATRRWK